MPKKTTSKIKLELWDILLVILVLYSASLYLENAKLHDLWPDEGRDAFEAYTLMENNFNLFLMHTFHPPLTQLVMSVAFYIFGPTDTVARWVIPMFAILGLIFTYILGSMLYDKKVGLISSFLLSNSWVYMFYSARILTDISVTAVATLATFCFYYAINNRSTKAWVLFAITFLLAFLTKEQAWLIPVGIAIYVLLTVILLTLKRGKVGLTLLDEPELSWLKDKNFLVMVGLVLLVLIPWALLNFNIVDLAVKRLTTKIVSIEEQPDPLFYVFELPTYIFFNDPGIYLLLLIFLLAAFTLAIYVDPKKGIFLFSITAGYILVLSLWNLKDYRYILLSYPPIYIIISSFFNNLQKFIPKLDKYLWLFLILVIFVSSKMHEAGTAFIIDKSQSYYGYKQAAEYLKPLLGSNETIIATSYMQMRFYLLRDVYGPPTNSTDLEDLIRRESIRYIEIDQWEYTQPQYLGQYIVSNPDRFALENAFLEPAHVQQGQNVGYS